MIVVPELNIIDVTWGNIKHLPKWGDLPQHFQRRWHGGEPYCDFISAWFYNGRAPEDMARLVEKNGVDRAKALRAISAAMRSFEPKHEHKIVGCGYLLSQWFDLLPEAKK